MIKINETYQWLKVVLIAAFLVPGILLSQRPAEEAVTYFEEGEYQHALDLWYAMKASGNTSAGLYFNIGLAESKLNHTDRAMLAFEQALRIKPGNRDIKKAIASEREKIFEAAIPVRPFFLKEWYKQFVMLFRPGVWALLSLGLFLVLIIRFIYQFRQEPRDWAKRLYGIRFVLVAAFVMIVVAFLSYAELHRDNEAIISEACGFYQAPSADSPQISEIGEGEKVVIMDQIGDWYNVYLVNQDAGWVKIECLLPIKIGETE